MNSAASVGRLNSLALDSSEYPRISYFDNTNTGPKYAVGVPEPSTLVIFGLSLARVLARRRRAGGKSEIG